MLGAQHLNRTLDDDAIGHVFFAHRMFGHQLALKA
jgi:hypothetical protein